LKQQAQPAQQGQLKQQGRGMGVGKARRSRSKSPVNATTANATAKATAKAPLRQPNANGAALPQTPGNLYIGTPKVRVNGSSL
jgi:hypothetical protein